MVNDWRIHRVFAKDKEYVSTRLGASLHYFTERYDILWTINLAINRFHFLRHYLISPQPRPLGVFGCMSLWIYSKQCRTKESHQFFCKRTGGKTSPSSSGMYDWRESSDERSVINLSYDDSGEIYETLGKSLSFNLYEILML